MKGFRLGATVAEMPPLLVAALRPGMLRLAGREGDERNECAGSAGHEQRLCIFEKRQKE